MVYINIRHHTQVNYFYQVWDIVLARRINKAWESWGNRKAPIAKAEEDFSGHSWNCTQNFFWWKFKETWFESVVSSGCLWQGLTHQPRHTSMEKNFFAPHSQRGPGIIFFKISLKLCLHTGVGFVLPLLIGRHKTSVFSSVSVFCYLVSLKTHANVTCILKKLLAWCHQ